MRTTVLNIHRLGLDESDLSMPSFPSRGGKLVMEAQALSKAWRGYLRAPWQSSLRKVPTLQDQGVLLEAPAAAVLLVLAGWQDVEVA